MHVAANPARKVGMLLFRDRGQSHLLSRLFPFSDLGCTPTHYNDTSFAYLCYTCICSLPDTSSALPP